MVQWLRLHPANAGDMVGELRFHMPQGLAKKWENNGNSDRLFSWAPKSLQMVTAAMKLKDVYSLEENEKPRQHI